MAHRSRELLGSLHALAYLFDQRFRQRTDAAMEERLRLPGKRFFSRRFHRRATCHPRHGRAVTVTVHLQYRPRREKNPAGTAGSDPPVRRARRHRRARPPDGTRFSAGTSSHTSDKGLLPPTELLDDQSSPPPPPSPVPEKPRWQSPPCQPGSTGRYCGRPPGMRQYLETAREHGRVRTGKTCRETLHPRDADHGLRRALLPCRGDESPGNPCRLSRVDGARHPRVPELRSRP